MKSHFVFLHFLLLFCFFGNTYGQTKTFELPRELKEMSGLESLNTNTLVGINDGGNSAELFVLERDGTLRKKVLVTNAKNKDWEDLAIDDTYLYIGDFGNNANKRKDLCIYKVKIEDVLSSSSVNAEKISFNYKEQINFPPKAKEFKYDAEALVSIGENLFLFTKTNAKPWTGKAQVYRLPKKPGQYTVQLESEVVTGDDGWWGDAITAADAFGEHVYFTTYNQIIILKFAKGKLIKEKTVPFEKPSQIESIWVEGENKFVVADEKHDLFGGGKLYYIRP